MSSPSGKPPCHRYKGPTPLPPNVPEAAIDALSAFQYRDDDILIASYPKCGTHWINEVVQLIVNDGDVTKLDYRHRRSCLELIDTPDLSKLSQVKPTIELVGNDPSPRVLMTHLGPSYLSEETWKKRIPVIFIFRDPRDAFISQVNFLRNFRGFDGQPLLNENVFDPLLEDFISDEVAFGNWCDYALAYERRAAKGENILFVTYEDMKKDLTSVIKSIAAFIGHKVSDEVVAKIVANSTVDVMKRNYQEAAKKQNETNVELSNFIKTGVAGKWKTDVSAEKWKKLNDSFKERVKDSVYAKQYFEY